MYGFQGRILVVDAGRQQIDILEKSAAYYRKYMGGALLCAALFNEFTKNRIPANGFAPENPIIFATGPLAGDGICGATRVNVMSMAPESMGIYLSQAGGEFGPALKRAGFDALIITGRSAGPVVIKSDQDAVTFMNAEQYWGQDRIVCYSRLRKELGDRFTMASIGPAGEKQVRHANIMFEPDHYAGRGGLGAVLGSKRVKAIAVAGDRAVSFCEPGETVRINREGGSRFIKSVKASPGSFLGVLRNLGTFGLLELNQKAGNLPTRNFHLGCSTAPDAAIVFSHQSARDTFVGRKAPCRNCYVACKKQSKANEAYSSLAEYESVATLGPNIGLEDDLATALEACERCNRLGLDTISTGNIIAWLMDCFENNVLTETELGYSIRFGDGQKAVALIEDIALRRGILGTLLADGVERAVAVLGEKTRPYLRFVRGIGIPAHMPRKKPGVGFGYLHGPNAGDHMKIEHDWIVADPGSLAMFQIDFQSTTNGLDANKIEILKATQIYFAAMDTLSLCLFVFGPGNIYSFDEIIGMVNAATGMDFTFAELMEIGERSIQLQRDLFIRTGGQDEQFLPFLAEEIPEGPSKGAHIRESDFDTARRHYYRIMGWDEDGRVIPETLQRLGLRDVRR